MVKIGTEELPLDGIEQPRLKLVLEHWTTLCGTRPMPSRRDVDPHALKGALGIVMIARYDPQQEDFRFSLFGTEIAHAQRADYTNKLAGELEPRAYGELIAGNYRQVRNSGRPYYGRMSLALGQGLVSYHRLVLPLGEDGTQVDAVLVASDQEKSFWQTLYDEEARHKPRPKAE
jgi:hypothetical protein